MVILGDFGNYHGGYTHRASSKVKLDMDYFFVVNTGISARSVASAWTDLLH